MTIQPISRQATPVTAERQPSARMPARTVAARLVPGHRNSIADVLATPGAADIELELPQRRRPAAAADFA
ncbi:hypothetical protein [Achromobacter marplatensis]|uniref:Uncharacterized protein n=1 Tax=Achromobacter marplatensis TaxID=470868 RepID=A0AA43B3M3_9BURK|nr:hypothetical protein [Achromobacter marplatensis]EJO29478.1 hypothetical protein QWC_21484 [Achromobacter marplatensis]KAG1058485.1 hypothetical protein G6F40_018269 [Rhizopus arrhizus]MDH2054498.1 hypothetical protein [Achromobacter marplatensis]